jgi:ABC-type polysaccharide/polyol phosphate transport system ATPase subunit
MINAIEINNLTKTFKIPHEKSRGIKEEVVNLFKKRRGYEELKVFDNLNLSIKKGEFIGITGPNGVGKSTLLKIIAKVIQPTSGKVHINGKISPFLELGTGFQNELTARENIFLYGAILGLTRKEVREKFDEIVTFSGLKKFLDTKLKNFSSGMMARLGFSIAIHVNADILLVDEVLAVGDEEFQKKCYKIFNKFKKEGKTIVLVSHDKEAIKRFCNREMSLRK